MVRPLGQQLFFLPGLYSVAEIVDEQTGELVKRKTSGMITRAANQVMRNIHNDGENRHRMPLYLPFDLAQEWLSELSEERYRYILTYELPSEDLEYYPVYTIRSSKGRPDGGWKTDLWMWENLPELGVGNPV